jgi:hypothetical protein
MWCGVAALVLSLFTPRLLLTLPILATIVLSGISIFRREKLRAGAVTVIVLASLLMLVSEGQFGSTHASSSSDVSNEAELVDYNWHADPESAGRGTIKWSASVKNLTERPIEMAKVDFTTYDAGGKLIATTFTYVHAIPPGGVRSDDSYADYYGNEASARVVVSEITFATQ